MIRRSRDCWFDVNLKYIRIKGLKQGNSDTRRTDSLDADHITTAITPAAIHPDSAGTVPDDDEHDQGDGDW